MKSRMKLFTLNLIIALFLCFINRISSQVANTAIQQPAAKKEVHSSGKVKLEVKTYQNDSTLKGWGYDVYADGALYIHQPAIPAIPGNRGFSSQHNALTAGNFAALKIRNNIMPPTISLNELDSLGVLK